MRGAPAPAVLLLLLALQGCLSKDSHPSSSSRILLQSRCQNLKPLCAPYSIHIYGAKLGASGGALAPPHSSGKGGERGGGGASVQYQPDGGAMCV
jgi:hypothetical protein